MRKKMFLCIGIIAGIFFSCFSASCSTQFPGYYEAEIGNVQFDCEVIAPETVSEKEHSGIRADGYCYADPNSTFSFFSNGKELEEEIEIGATENYPLSHIYNFSDGSQLYNGGHISYGSENAGWYADIGILTEKTDGDKNELAFCGSSQCLEELKNALDSFGVPSDYFVFQWYALKKEQLAQMEKQHVEAGLLEADRMKPGWDEEDEVYVIYGFQYVQDIPVFHETMGLYQEFALEVLPSAPLIAICSSRGIEILNINCVYHFTETEEKYDLLTPDKIIQVPAEKYNNILGDTQNKVEQMKFYLRVGRTIDQKLTAEPIWRFTINDGTEKKRITLVNAVTGEEIFIQ